MNRPEHKNIFLLSFFVVTHIYALESNSFLLQLISQDKNVFVFRADTHQFMDVVVEPGKDHVHIKIMHYGELHVAIELQRNPA